MKLLNYYLSDIHIKEIPEFKVYYKVANLQFLLIIYLKSLYD